MKNNKKRIICIVLCLTLMFGSSLSAMAASGTVSYSKYSIKYNTSSTRIYMTTGNCNDAYYQLKGKRHCLNASCNNPFTLLISFDYKI